MASIPEVARAIAKSRRLKRALFAEDATEADLISIFVDFGLSIFEATKSSCVRTYGLNRHIACSNSTDVKKFIKETPFPDIVQIDLHEFVKQSK